MPVGSYTTTRGDYRVPGEAMKPQSRKDYEVLTLLVKRIAAILLDLRAIN